MKKVIVAVAALLALGGCAGSTGAAGDVGMRKGHQYAGDYPAGKLKPGSYYCEANCRYRIEHAVGGPSKSRDRDKGFVKVQVREGDAVWFGPGWYRESPG